MPIFDYKCSRCNNKEQRFHSVQECPLVTCKRCNAQMIKQAQDQVKDLAFNAANRFTRRRK